ncbi:MAG: lysophospholipid acyltransferase family protein [Chloroflexi bacterium]|nr:lysophospholipid acyltransferase family protein [Chloroflexota bacterium]
MRRIPVLGGILRKWRFYLMWSVIQTIGRMPLSWRYGIARFVSDRIYNWGPNIGKNVRSNIRHVLGPKASDADVDRIARQCARNTGRYYADVVGMGRMDVQQFMKDDLVLEGLEYVRAAQAAGRGVVLASAHYANPEFAVQGLAAQGLHVFALVEPLEPPELGRLMRGLRAVHGHVYAPVSFSAVKAAMAWLRNAGVVAILIDRDLQRRGMELEFCGAKARFPTGAVDLALRTNAVLVPGWVRREGGFKIRAVIGPEMELIRTGNAYEDLRLNSQRLLSLFEVHLKQDPGQWSVLDRIWPEDADDSAAEVSAHEGGTIAPARAPSMPGGSARGAGAAARGERGHS